MQSIFDFVASTSGIFILAITLMILLILVLTLANTLRIDRLTKKYNNFMNVNSSDNLPIGDLLENYIREVRTVNAEHTELKIDISNMTKQLSGCFQKMGVIRYNPFEGMGGDQCYVVALLDEADNGVVLNGIYSRDASFTYAKPIENGESTYSLSAEEIQALDIARKNNFKIKLKR